jgi:hypothetical protein
MVHTVGERRARRRDLGRGRRANPGEGQLPIVRAAIDAPEQDATCPGLLRNCPVDHPA